MISNIQRPLDNYDAPAWRRYYASRPDMKRSVGAEGDDGDGDGGDGGDGDGAGAGAQPDIGKAVADAVAAAMAPVVAGMTALQQRMQAPAKEDDDDYDDGDKGDKGGGGEVDFDLMTNKELVAHFQNEMVVMGKAFAKELGNMRSSGERTAAQVEADRMGDKYDDFWGLKDEIGKEIKGNMYLTMEQAYKLAKVNNPDKVGEIAKTRATKGKEGKDLKKEKEEEEDRKEMPFGGLLPTSGRVRPNQKMDMKAAGEAAWQSVFGTASGNNSVN